MTYRIYAILLLTMLLVTACGRRLPEAGTAGPPARAEATTQPTAVITEEPTANAPQPEDATAEEPPPATTAEAEADASDPIAQAIAAGDVELGQQVFNLQHTTASGPWMCASCHSVDSNRIRLVGPGLWGLAQDSTERLANTDSETVPEYIYASIVNPNVYIAPANEAGPYPENLMPANYADVLTEEELNGLVAYILTLNE